MQIEHIAIWTRDLDRLKGFYEAYFGVTTGPRYINPAKGFESYFVSFDGGGARLELMRLPSLSEAPLDDGTPWIGYAHLAISVGSRERVDQLTAQMRADGVPVVDGPRQTGDGYYESVVLDPDGNRVEITA